GDDDWGCDLSRLFPPLEAQHWIRHGAGGTRRDGDRVACPDPAGTVQGEGCWHALHLPEERNPKVVGGPLSHPHLRVFRRILPRPTFPQPRPSPTAAFHFIQRGVRCFDERLDGLTVLGIHGETRAD